MNRLKKLIGKTIKSVGREDEERDAIALHFTDDTYLYVEMEEQWGGGELFFTSEWDVAKYPKHHTTRELVTLGFITTEEKKVIDDNALREMQIEATKQSVKMKKKRREEYKRLKKEFG